MTTGLLIKTVDRAAGMTARYLLFRARQAWPEAIAVDRAGERHTVWATQPPTAFRLYAAEPDTTARGQAARVLTCEIEDDSVRLSWANEIAEELALRLAKDAIWGPDWAYETRTTFREAKRRPKPAARRAR